MSSGGSTVSAHHCSYECISDYSKLTSHRVQLVLHICIGCLKVPLAEVLRHLISAEEAIRYIEEIPG